MKDLGTAVPFCRPFRVCREKDSAQTLRTGRPRGEFVFGQNSTAETSSTQSLRRKNVFPTDLLGPGPGGRCIQDPASSGTRLIGTSPQLTRLHPSPTCALHYPTYPAQWQSTENYKC